VPAEQLQDAPLGEHVTRLEAPAVPRHVEAPGDHGDPELGPVSVGSVQHLARDPRGSPWP
jgi:hypothetical protein